MISYKETAIGLVDYDEVWSTYQENLRLSPNEALELAGDISKRRSFRPITEIWSENERDPSRSNCTGTHVTSEATNWLPSHVRSSATIEDNKITDRLQALEYY
jgi:hypothetical protein